VGVTQGRPPQLLDGAGVQVAVRIEDAPPQVGLMPTSKAKPDRGPLLKFSWFRHGACGLGAVVDHGKLGEASVRAGGRSESGRRYRRRGCKIG
jgi:hypothetical protein